jgi:hypothetical protein
MIGRDVIKLRLAHEKQHDIESLKKFSFIHNVERREKDDLVIISVENANRNLPVILKHIDTEWVEYTSPTLNDVFLRSTGRDIKEEPEGGFMEKFARYDQK